MGIRRSAGDGLGDETRGRSCAEPGSYPRRALLILSVAGFHASHSRAGGFLIQVRFARAFVSAYLIRHEPRYFQQLAWRESVQFLLQPAIEPTLVQIAQKSFSAKLRMRFHQYL
jgi:hypothetical protein